MYATKSDLERLGDEIAELSAHLHAARYRLLVQLREFDEREGWGGGFLSCAHWLSWRTGIAPCAAREKVRVARSLAYLPHTGDAMRKGTLSYTKVRAITRVATAENEEQLLDLARHSTAAQLEKIVRAWRRTSRLEEQQQDERRRAARNLTFYIDEDGSYVIRGRLDPETGAILERALEAAATEPTEGATYPQRRVDALRHVAEVALAGGPRARNADRFQVVVHVDAAALEQSSERGQSVLGDGIRVSAETSRRIACDSTRVVMTHDAEGNVLDVGRKSRSVPTPIRRALEHRDQRCCRFPGCQNRICDVHHLEHWADGGETRLSNLMLLCTRHHTLVHEGGFRVVVGNGGEMCFQQPDGRRIPDVPDAPALVEDPCARLLREHDELGLAMDAWAATPEWHGEKLDLEFAMMTLG
jgi:hypothetical protein